ncbi:hypothetical protein F975_02060 [Acinetobacter sp. ANC 3789]|uniref:fimbria/pilus outer membrane usher protein n=1 Tax=Acinetobacter sp. ANC 3789 TaxID=1217714 RepID=UPI0002CE694D|nr:fimbria/pilus outer membrane usher protein [Acinetobacter sp. ANC 3789]ENU80304.1 hypothetical protein F975_02060 [Acinetobacter sp. ANC 3789]
MNRYNLFFIIVVLYVTAKEAFSAKLPNDIIVGGTEDLSFIPKVTQDINFKNNNLTPDGYIPLFLSITVNTSNSSDLVNVKQDKSGNLYIIAKDLRTLRIIIDQKINDNDLLDLKKINNLKYIYDKNKQILNISVPSVMLEKYNINLGGQNITSNDLLKSKTLTSSIINYSFYNTNTDGYNVFSGTADIVLSTVLGNLSTGFLYNNDRRTSYNHDDTVRLSTNWQYIDPINVKIYTLGDFVTNTTEWGSSIRVAGLQWASAYTQRADIITSALPQFSGSAALPSTLDLYINQQKIYSGEIPSGPFDLKSLPYVSGNNITLITTDAIGKQQVTKKAYYFSPKILTKGINEFSIDVGVPRYNYGTQSNDYDDVVFGSGSIRYGLSDTLTLSGGAEGSTDGLTNLGFGVAKNIFGLGVLNADLAESHYKDHSGLSSLIGLEGRISSKLSFNTSFQKNYDDYYNLAKVSEARYQNYSHQSINPDNILYSAYANQITRFGLNYNFKQNYSFYAGYNAIKKSNIAYKLLSFNFGVSLNKNWSIYTSAYQDLEDNKNYGLYLTLRYVPFKNVNVNTSITNDSGTTSYREEITGSSDQRVGGIGWGAYVEHNNNGYDSSSISGSYRTRPAYLAASYSQYNKTQQTMVSATGAIVAAANRIFLANQIGDGYAIIENAGPNTEILNGGVDLGKTDAKGRFLISDLIPYQEHRIFADPAYMPLDWDLDRTEQTLVTGYKQGAKIDFGAHKVISAVIRLIDKNQQPISPGYSVKVNGVSNSMVGYDGEVFVQGLLSENTLEIDLLGQGTCTVHFDYGEKISSTKKLGPFICQ